VQRGRRTTGKHLAAGHLQLLLPSVPDHGVEVQRTPAIAQPALRQSSQGGRAQLCGRLIVFRSKSFQLWAESPALAPGARCRGCRSVRSGAPRAMQWTAIAARNIRDPLRVLEQGPDRQRAPVWCSGGVSSIDGASESRCSHDGSAGRSRQGPQRIRHRSSP